MSESGFEARKMSYGAGEYAVWRLPMLWCDMKDFDEVLEDPEDLDAAADFLCGLSELMRQRGKYVRDANIGCPYMLEIIVGGVRHG